MRLNEFCLLDWNFFKMISSWPDAAYSVSFVFPIDFRLQWQKVITRVFGLVLV